MIAAPLFHSWGFAHFTLGMRAGLDARAAGASSTPRRRSSLTAQHQCHGARRRAGDAPADPRARRRGARALRPLGAARRRRSRGSALPGALVATAGWTCSATNLYNLYGSTEVAWATIATPEDLRAAPGTAGRPPRGTIVQALRRGRQRRSRRATTGRIFVGNELPFEGYTGGGGKDVDRAA